MSQAVHETEPLKTPGVQPLLDVRHLRKWFPVMGGLIAHPTAHVRAVDDVSFCIDRGETLGLVGESGCGKTTVARAILRLVEPDEGEIWFDGQDIRKLGPRELRHLRPRMQIIFQDPYASLNPRLPVKEIVGRAVSFHGIAKGRERDERVLDILGKVGIQPSQATRYPHEFSGGQRQRIGIARALALNPELIVADEPVSALDVSIQSQILNLLSDLQEEFGVAYLFIAHGLNVVKHVSDRIGVMYLGKIVEMCDGEELYENPLHPYTQALISAIPEPDPTYTRKRIILAGDVPSPVKPPPGCRFHTRCSRAQKMCSAEEPQLQEVHPGHLVACHLCPATLSDEIERRNQA